MTDNSTFLGFDKKQIPLLALLAAFGGIIIALQMGMRSDMNANHAATQADIHDLHSRIDALDNAHRADMNALRSEISALRSETNAEINDLDSRIDVLSVEAAETNARIVNIEGRIENIERSLPAYAYVDERIDGLELEQARINELVADLVSAE